MSRQPPRHRALSPIAETVWSATVRMRRDRETVAAFLTAWEAFTDLCAAQEIDPLMGATAAHCLVRRRDRHGIDPMDDRLLMDIKREGAAT